MLTISSTGTSLPVAATGALAVTSPLPLTNDSGIDLVEASTQLTLGASEAMTVIYSKPSLQDQRFEQPRAWASPPDDAISQRMQRNVGNARLGLAASWRGIGGDLLSRFNTTQTDYFQTVADYDVNSGTLYKDASGQIHGSTRLTSGVQALAMVEDGAVKASLQIRTRSGQTVDIKISVNSKEYPVSRGLHAEVHSSGKLTTAERKALAALAEGLDKALEGLGNSASPKLDLSGLLNYDKSVLSQLDLTVKGPYASAPLALFELHLDASQQRITLDGQAGKLAISVNTLGPLVAVNKQQQQDTILKYLAQIDAAATRSHSNPTLLTQFKDAFTQLHSAASGSTTSAAPATLSNTIQAQVQPLLSGLNDFQASFGGDFANGNSEHYTTEAGHSEFQMSQQTSIQAGSVAGDVSIRQTLRTHLEADYKQSRGGAMLDTRQGNYDSYRIEDSSMAMTSIDVSQHRVSSAVKQTLLKQFLGFEKLVNHRVVEKSGTPTAQSLSENLL